MRKVSAYVFILCLTSSFIFSGCATMTPLTKAANDGDINAINQLLNNGANINEITAEGWQASPLIWALYSGKNEAAKFIIEKGANINKSDNYGKTPLMYAIENNNFDLVKLLIQRGADVKRPDNYGKTPLMYAAEIKNFDIFNILNISGADIDTKTQAGHDAFLSSIIAGDSSIIETFIKKGADINAKTIEGITPLMHAVISGDNKASSVKILLANGADIFARDKYGNSVVMHAALYNHKDVIEIIKDYAVSQYKDKAPDSYIKRSADWGIGGNMGFEMPSNKTRIEYLIRFEECKVSTKYLEGHNSPAFYLAGPISFGFEYLNSRKFQQCMEAYGYKCVNNCLVK